jgi:hypothetical protein
MFQSSRAFPKDFIPVLSGHTRFATSSKATLEGTHPHRWTPPSARLVYDFSVPHGNEGHCRTAFTPQMVQVENYVTHNGDFDFYVVNGKTYDLEKIQKWLAITTGSPMPAVVDSCAVAGVVDLLRTQGCFGLSARYAVCLGLPTSKIEERIDNFPPYSHFEKIGHTFEEVLGEMLKASPDLVDTLCDQQEVRQSFALRVLSKIEAHFDTLVKPIERYIDSGKRGQPSRILQGNDRRVLRQRPVHDNQNVSQKCEGILWTSHYNFAGCTSTNLPCGARSNSKLQELVIVFVGRLDGVLLATTTICSFVASWFVLGRR